MPIKRCKDQSRISLIEFYEELKSNPATKNTGEEMQKIVRWLNEYFVEKEIYGLTSHSRLILLSEDKSSSPSYVIISADPIKYYIEYLMPYEVSPWERAYVSGWTDNLEDAKKYIIIGMKNSKGWRDSNELN